MLTCTHMGVKGLTTNDLVKYFVDVHDGTDRCSVVNRLSTDLVTLWSQRLSLTFHMMRRLSTLKPLHQSSIFSRLRWYLEIRFVFVHVLLVLLVCDSIYAECTHYMLSPVHVSAVCLSVCHTGGTVEAS